MHKKQIEQSKETNWTINLNQSKIVPKSRKCKADNISMYKKFILKGNLTITKGTHKQQRSQAIIFPYHSITPLPNTIKHGILAPEETKKTSCN